VTIVAVDVRVASVVGCPQHGDLPASVKVRQGTGDLPVVESEPKPDVAPRHPVVSRFVEQVEDGCLSGGECAVVGFVACPLP
jgi:hypothetical protein